jgi:hypothetical protein
MLLYPQQIQLVKFWEVRKVRTIIYGVKELRTGKIVYVNYYQSECIKKIEELGEGYELRHQWKSF